MIQADYNYINSLLNKFMKAQTTEEEEQTLSDFFFTNHELPQEWLVYKDLFCSFKTDAYDLGDDVLEEMLKPASSQKRISIGLLRWVVAACVAMAFLAFGWQYYYGVRESTPRYAPANVTFVRGEKGNSQSASKAQQVPAKQYCDILPHSEKNLTIRPELELERRSKLMKTVRLPRWRV